MKSDKYARAAVAMAKTECQDLAAHLGSTPLRLTDDAVKAIADALHLMVIRRGHGGYGTSVLARIALEEILTPQLFADHLGKLIPAGSTKMACEVLFNRGWDNTYFTVSCAVW